MLQWNDLEVILAVGRAGTLSGAARHLGVNHSTVFRKVNAIEERVGVRFFERLQGGYHLTEAGQLATARAERIESEVHGLGREILGQDTRLQGHVRVTTMEGLASLVLPGPITEFCRQHPGLLVELMGTSSNLDLSRREAEVAVRATRKPPDSAFGRKVCRFRFGLYTAPSYLERHGDRPLAEQEWCLLQGIISWLVPKVWKHVKDAEEQVVLTTSSIVSVANAAAAGIGVTALPSYVGEPDPRLLRIGDFIEPLTLDLWLLTHPDLRHTARVQALMDFLYGFLREHRHLFEGDGGE